MHVQGGGRRADVKGGVVCLDRPSVCMYQGCAGSVLEVCMCLIHQLLHTYASMNQCAGGV